MAKYKVNVIEKNFGSEESIGKFAVAFVEYGDACDGFPGILGVYDTLAEAAQDMLADIHDYKNNVSGVRIEPTGGVSCLGMKTPAVCSDGTTLTLPAEKLRRLDRRLRKAQRRYSRRKKDSRRRAKALRRKQRIQERINHVRGDAIHKFTSAVCKNHATVVIEDLNAVGMHHGPKNIRSGMQRSCMAEVLRQLSYKATNLVVADRWYPSTQLCSNCGARQKMELTERVYNCPHCGLSLDRDLNAAINLSKYPGSQG